MAAFLGAAVVAAVPGAASAASQPTIDFPLSPQTAQAGGAQFQLEVVGSNFSSSAVVTWNGTALATTSPQAGDLVATVPASDIATAGGAEVAVDDPTSGTSDPQVFPITATGAPVTKVATVTTAQTSNVEVSTGGTQGPFADASGTGTLSLAQFSADPVTVPAPSGSTTYLGVDVGPGNAFGSATVRSCSPPGTAIFGFDGTSWSMLPDQSYDPTSACMDAVLTAPTLPSMTYLAVAPLPAPFIDRQLSPISIQTGQSTSFQINVDVFDMTSNAYVDWNGAPQSSTEYASGANGNIVASLPPTVVANPGAALITVDDRVPGVAASNPQIFPITQTGAGVVVANSGTSSNPGGGVQVSAGGNTGPFVSGTGTGTLSFVQYNADPITTAGPAGTVEYLGTDLSPGNTFGQVTVQSCSAPGTAVFGFDGTTWSQLPGQTYDPVSSCVDATVNAASVPDMTYLALATPTTPVPTTPPYPHSWPMFQHDPQHDGQSGAAGPASSSVAWTFGPADGYSPVGTPPIVGADGTVYVARVNQRPAPETCMSPGDSVVDAVSPQGQLLWEWHDTCQTILRSGMAVTPDGVLYVVDRTGLVAVANGVLQWRLPMNSEGEVTLGHDGTIYVQDTSSTVHVVAPDGTQQFSIEPASCCIGTRGSVALSPDASRLYVPSSEGNVLAYDTSGNFQWVTHVGGAGTGIENAPAVGPDGTIYAVSMNTVGSTYGALDALSPTGSVLWSAPMTGAVETSPAVGSDGQVVVGNDDGVVTAYDTATGAQAWSYSTPWGDPGSNGFNNSSPLIDANGTTYVQNQYGVAAIDLHGHTVWSAPAQAYGSSLALDPNSSVLYAVTNAGLVAFGPPTAPPNAPTGLTAAAYNGQAQLSWTAPAGGAQAFGYNILVGTASGAESATPVNSTPVTGTSYDVTGLSNGTPYYFEVEAVNAAGSSTASNEASAVPAAPAIYSLSPAAVAAGSADFTITITGTLFDPGASVTVNGTPVSSTYVSSTEMQAQIPAGMVTTVGADSVVVDDNDLYGSTAPVVFFVNQTSATVESSTSGTSTSSTGSVTVSTGGTSGPLATASGTGTLSLAQYSTNPTTVAPPAAVASYLDVNALPGNTFGSVTVTDCNLAGTTLYWFDGTSWSVVSPQSYDPTTGCVTATLDPTTSPNITQLAGTPFAVAPAPPALVGLNSLTVSGSRSVVDSFDSATGAYIGAAPRNFANAFSNGTISLNAAQLYGSLRSAAGNVALNGGLVTGDVTAATTIKANGATVQGSSTAGHPTAQLSPPSVARCSYTAQPGITGKYSYSPTTGVLAVAKGATATLAPGSYCFQNVTVAQGATLATTGTGPVVISLTGALKVAGSLVNPSGHAADLQIESSYTGSRGVAVTGGAAAAFTIYAPGTDVTVSGASPIFGALLGKTLTITGSSPVHYDTALLPVWAAYLGL